MPPHLESIPQVDGGCVHRQQNRQQDDDARRRGEGADLVEAFRASAATFDGSVAIGDVVLFREAWTGNGTGKVLDPSKHGSGDIFNVGFGGNMTGNHPVAMPYPFNNAKSTYNGVTTGARVALTEWQKDPTTFDIRLFNGKDVAAPATGDAGMECSSCHDPHNGATVKDDLFVRGFLGGTDTTYICLKCHIK